MVTCHCRLDGTNMGSIQWGEGLRLGHCEKQEAGLDGPFARLWFSLRLPACKMDLNSRSVGWQRFGTSLHLVLILLPNIKNPQRMPSVSRQCILILS